MGRYLFKISPYFMGKTMLNKIIIAIASSLTIALISFGIYSAREYVEREPVCYWHLETGFNSINYAETYILLIIGVGVGVLIMTVINAVLDA